jgi:hypothetical protein
VEGSALTYTFLHGPANGTFSSAAQNLTYTPKADFNGNDSITFRVSDGILNSADATVSIGVKPVNDAPIAFADNVSTRKNTSVTISVLSNDRDVDGGALTITSVTQPSRGSATFTGTSVRYLPKGGFTGTDSFNYTISDGKGGAATAKVTINVLR